MSDEAERGRIRALMNGQKDAHRGSRHAGTLGLTAVVDERLRALLTGLHRETLACPLTIVGLTCHGLQDCAGPLLGHLRGLDAAGVRAVVVAVLAERAYAQQAADSA